MPGLTITAVTPGSIADELDVASGDRLLAVNGTPLRDLIDFSYFTSAENTLLLEIEKPDGELWELEVDRGEGESLGLTFNPPSPVRCANNCLFCFVHQLPKGLRRPLYVKDEDYRLSFLNGNYVTLANLKPSALKRIIDQRLSPLYVSVHATDPDVREMLLGTKGIPPILEQLRTLASAGIVMHTQVVLCPGLNDGDILRRTVDDLASLFPSVRSLAVVPLGLTVHRSGLPRLAPVDTAYAAAFVSVWQPQADLLRRRMKCPFLFLADEFYLKGGVSFPSIRSYGDFPQIENGVGLVPTFQREAAYVLRRARHIGKFKVTVVTGVSSHGFVSEFTGLLSELCGVEIVVRPVVNRLFGAPVTVTGLVSGNDIIGALAGLDVGECLLIPDIMLKEGEDVFLDDVSPSDVEQRLGCRVSAFDSTPGGFYSNLKSIGRQLDSCAKHAAGKQLPRIH